MKSPALILVSRGNGQQWSWWERERGVGRNLAPECEIGSILLVERTCEVVVVEECQSIHTNVFIQQHADEFTLQASVVLHMIVSVPPRTATVPAMRSAPETRSSLHLHPLLPQVHQPIDFLFFSWCDRFYYSSSLPPAASFALIRQNGRDASDCGLNVYCGRMIAEVYYCGCSPERGTSQ